MVVRNGTTVIQRRDVKGRAYIDGIAETTGQCCVEQRESLFCSQGLIQFGECKSVSYVLQVRRIPGLGYVDQIQVQPLETSIRQGGPFSQTTVVERGGLDDEDIVYQFFLIMDASPTPYSIKNPVDVNIMLRLRNYNTEFDASTLVFKVNGVDVAGECSLTPLTGALQIDYNPLVDFPYGSRVFVYVEIHDVGDPPIRFEYDYWFDIIPDYKAPFITNLDPGRFETGVGKNRTIRFDILDFEEGVNPDSIELLVGGVQVEPQLTVISGGYHVSYSPLVPYVYGSTVPVVVRARDVSSQQNQLWDAYVFYIEGGQGPFFNIFDPKQCAVLVPLRKDVSLFAWSLNDGLDETSLELKVDRRTVPHKMESAVYWASVESLTGDEDPLFFENFFISEVGDAIIVDSSTELSVDITTLTGSIVTSGCYFIVNNTVCSGSLTPLGEGGYRLSWNPPNDFKHDGLISVVVHAEDVNAGVFEKLYTLYSGYKISYEQPHGEEYDHDKEIQVWVSALNEQPRRVCTGASYVFHTRPLPRLDLSACIRGTGGYSGLGANLGVVTDAFYPGAHIVIELDCRDFAGNQMPTLKFDFTISE